MKVNVVGHHKIEFQPKKELYPRYGVSYPNISRASVREDIPKCARMFVLVHEAYHLSDSQDNLFLRELKANLYPLWAIPAGAIWVFFSSIFSKDRRKYLIEYFSKKKG
jgi:hypothetical protein